MSSAEEGREDLKEQNKGKILFDLTFILEFIFRWINKVIKHG